MLIKEDLAGSSKATHCDISRKLLFAVVHQTVFLPEAIKELM